MMSYSSPIQSDDFLTSSTQAHIDVPRGLQFLTPINELLIKQKSNGINGCTACEKSNKYTITNNRGETLFSAYEEEDYCGKLCLGSGRRFSISVLDTNENEIIYITREHREKIKVYSPRNTLIGTVVGTLSLFGGNFKVKNEKGIKVMKIEGPAVRLGNADFKILSLHKSIEIGRISKQWGGLLKELFTDLDHFRVSFPIDLDVRMKAVLIGACLLIDFLYYED